MEELSLLKLIAVGVPETVLNLFIGLVLCRDNVKKDWSSFIFKMIISVIAILTVIFFIRRNITSLICITTITSFMYILTFKLVWQMNYRQSILSGCTTMFILVSLESITLPLYNVILTTFNLPSFFSGTLFFASFLRILHALIFIFFTRYNLRNNELISGRWKSQSKYSKVAIIIIITSMVWCMLSMLNYSDIYYKIIVSQEDLSFLKTNVNLIFLISICFFIFLLVLMYYVFSFLDTQKMLDISVEEIFSIVGDELSQEEILQCMNLLQKKYIEKGGE